MKKKETVVEEDKAVNEKEGEGGEDKNGTEEQQEQDKKQHKKVSFFGKFSKDPEPEKEPMKTEIPDPVETNPKGGQGLKRFFTKSKPAEEAIKKTEEEEDEANLSIRDADDSTEEDTESGGNG